MSAAARLEESMRTGTEFIDTSQDVRISRIMQRIVHFANGQNAITKCRMPCNVANLLTMHVHITAITQAFQVFSSGEKIIHWCDTSPGLTYGGLPSTCTLRRCRGDRVTNASRPCRSV